MGMTNAQHGHEQDQPSPDLTDAAADTPAADAPVDAPADAPAYGTDSDLRRTDRSSIGLVVLVVLAVLASVIMLISGSAAALKLALLASLWAAVLGFFLVTRYRREVAEREYELELREEAFTAELDRLKAAKGLAAVDSSAQNDVLADIKRELEAIRAQLDDLAGSGYTYEPAALQAEARRIAEIESHTGMTGYHGYAVGSHGAAAGVAHDAAGDAVEPEVSFTQSSAGAPSADAIAGRLGTQPTHPRHDNPLADLIKERDARGVGLNTEAPTAARDAKSPESTFSTGSFQAVRWDQGGIDESGAKATAKTDTAKSGASKADASQDDAADAVGTDAGASAASADSSADASHETKHGRRRSDAGRTGTKSVAELMAELKKGK